MKCLPIFFFFIVQISHSQDLTLIKLTKEEINRKVKYHYQWESIVGHVAVIDLFLFRDQTFEYSEVSNVYYAYSFGKWESDGNIVVLNSDFQKGTLPIKVTYRQRDTFDFTVKKIAFVRDLNEKPISNAFVHINNDSTSCMDGDLLCNREYKQIDSIKVVLENNGPSSNWVSIIPHTGLVQITILTTHDLRNYFILKDRKYNLDGGRLKYSNDN